MSLQSCSSVQALFSGLLDGTLTGREMQRIATHSESCSDCRAELGEWRGMQAALGSLGPVAAPDDMGLRLRVAVSQARARAAAGAFAGWEMAWRNTVRPLALQWSAGLATALAVVTCIGMLFGMFAAPYRVQASTAKDEPLGMATAPCFAYTLVPAAPLKTDYASALVVEVYLNADGRVYDYRILAGEDTPAVRAQLNSALYFSVFAPATVFGQPVRGHAVVSYAGVAVRG